MTAVPDVLSSYGVDLTDRDFASELSLSLSTLLGASATPLPSPEMAYLAEHAGGNAASIVADWDSTRSHQRQIAASVRTVKQVLDGALSIDEAAAKLGRNRTRVSHWLHDGALWAVTVGGRRRIPAWQVHNGRLLPGLPAVVSAIPVDAHPLDVEGVMTTPQDELGGRTPITHLAGGGDPQPVADLLADLDRW